MGTKDPRVDASIDKAADFAKPVLTKLRKLVHQACPEVAESIKWGIPTFDYKGPLVEMAAFKQHCSFGFWKAALLFGAAGSSEDVEKSSTWGAPGSDLIPAKITRLDDLPADAKILAPLKRAKKLNDDGVTIPNEKSVKPVPPMPADFAAGLRKSKTAAAVFAEFTPSQKREYIEWISEGKQRNWKYQK